MQKSPDPALVRDDIAADPGIAGADRVVLGLMVRNVQLRETGGSGVRKIDHATQAGLSDEFCRDSPDLAEALLCCEIRCGGAGKDYGVPEIEPNRKSQVKGTD